MGRVKTIPLLCLKWVFCGQLCQVGVYTQNLRAPAVVVAVSLWAVRVPGMAANCTACPFLMCMDANILGKSD